MLTPATPVLLYKRVRDKETLQLPATARKVLLRRRALQEFYSLKETEAQPSVDVEELIKTGDAAELLRVRNQAAGRLNLHDLQKKLIIYDNYYELIKLNNVLSQLDSEDGRGLFGEIEAFFNEEAPKFNRDFELVSLDRSTAQHG